MANTFSRALLIWAAALLPLFSVTAWPAGQPLDSYGDLLPEGAAHRLGTRRMRYEIAAADYNADGRGALVLSGSELHVWDLLKGERVERHVLSESPLISLSLNSDRSRALIADQQGKLIVWGVATQEAVHQVQLDFKAGVISIVWSADESRCLVLEDSSDRLQEWSVSSGERLRHLILPGPTHYFEVIYGPDESTAFVAKEPDPNVAHYDLATGRLLGAFLENFRAPDIQLSSDGARILVGSRHMASEWDAQSYQLLYEIGRRIHSGYEVPRLSYARGMRHVLSGSRDGSVRLWSEDRTTVLHRWFPNRAETRILAVSPDGEWVLTYGEDKLLAETNLTTGAWRLDWARHFGSVQALLVAAEGAWVATGSSDGFIWLWDATEGRPVRRIESSGGEVWALAQIGPSRLAVGSRDGSIRLIDSESGREDGTLKGHSGYVRALLASGDGSLISAADDGSLILWNVADGRLVRRFGGGLGNGHFGGVLAVAAQGGRMASAGHDGRIRLWDLESGEQMRSILAHPGEISAIDMKDGRVVSAGADGLVIEWDLASGRVLRELNQGSEVSAVRYLADGGIAAGDVAGRVTHWPAEGAQAVWTRAGHADAVTALALGPDGRLYSASSDTTAILWDLMKPPAP